MTDVSKYYKIEGEKLIRTHKTCIKCGPGYFLADHYDRWSCGNCGYTVFKRKGKKGVSSRQASGTKRRSPRKRRKSM
jgi:small subunit ribosomal protein S27Ae